MKHESVPPPTTTVRSSEEPPEKHQISSSHDVSTVVSNKALQAQSSRATVDQIHSKDEDGRVVTEGSQLKDAGQTTELGKDTQIWNQPCFSLQFQIPNAPSAPALYPSLPALEESPVVHLCELAMKNTERGPAVLALPEQESSSPGLQSLESVAELSRSKLYPELPKTAPEIQVV